jgi:Tfp pilus assembly protein PilX
MKLLLLKSLLQRRARDEGFTLPMVIALGLIMLLLGAVSMTTANEENITAIAQNSRSDALAIAEVGVARYRELLDRNRTLGVYDSGEWSARTEICNSNIVNFLPGVSNTVNLAEDGQVLNNDGDSTDSFTIGTYSLVSYEYTNDSTPSITSGTLNLTSDAANNNARGILRVKGTAPDGSEAQIQVEIPVRINPDDMTNLAPALWIGDKTVSAADLGTLTIGNNGKVVIKDQAITTGTTADGCRNFSDNSTSDGSQKLTTAGILSVISDNRELPSIQKIIDDVAAAALVTGDQTNDLPTTPSGGAFTFGSTTADPYKQPESPNTFSVSNDCKNIKSCRYYYDPPANPNTLTYDDVDVLTDGIAKTTLLLRQDLLIKATNKNVKVGSSSNFGSSDAFEIYVEGSGNDITIDAASGKTIDIRGFIHAPQSTLTITGTGTVNINGSVWVNDFVNSTATVNISPDNIKTSSTAGDKSYKFYSTTPSRTPKPLTGSPTNWKTEEVN